MNTLVVGGYGAVGRTIISELATAPDGPNQVYVAGRNGAKANSIAAEFGDHVSGVEFDVRDSESYARVLEDVDQAVMCVDQSETAFVEACLERGIDYLDITASDEFFRQVEALDDITRDGGATAVLSVGLAPGVTNLLAKQTADRLSTVSAIRIGVLLGLGEAFGPAASRWTLERIGREFTVADDGHSRTVRGFTDSRPMEFPRYGRRTAYSFDFADQHVLSRTFDVSATTRLCFDSRIITSAVYGLSRLGLYRPVARGVGIDRVTEFISARSIGGDGFAVTVGVEGRRGSVPTTLTAAIDGHEQSRATGLVAATVAIATRSTEVPVGVHHIHEILDSDPILDILRERGYRMTTSERTHGTTESVPLTP